MPLYLVSTDAQDITFERKGMADLRSAAFVVDAKNRTDAQLLIQAILLKAGLHKNELTVLNIS